jgi:hypothetical protein
MGKETIAVTDSAKRFVSRLLGKKDVLQREKEKEKGRAVLEEPIGVFKELDTLTRAARVWDGLKDTPLGTPGAVEYYVRLIGVIAGPGGVNQYVQRKAKELQDFRYDYFADLVNQLATVLQGLGETLLTFISKTERKVDIRTIPLAFVPYPTVSPQIKGYLQETRLKVKKAIDSIVAYENEARAQGIIPDFDKYGKIVNEAFNKITSIINTPKFEDVMIKNILERQKAQFAIRTKLMALSEFIEKIRAGDKTVLEKPILEQLTPKQQQIYHSYNSKIKEYKRVRKIVWRAWNIESKGHISMKLPPDEPRDAGERAMVNPRPGQELNPTAGWHVMKSPISGKTFWVSDSLPLIQEIDIQFYNVEEVDKGIEMLEDERDRKLLEFKRMAFEEQKEKELAKFKNDVVLKKLEILRGSVHENKLLAQDFEETRKEITSLFDKILRLLGAKSASVTKEAIKLPSPIEKIKGRLGITAPVKQTISEIKGLLKASERARRVANALYSSISKKIARLYKAGGGAMKDVIDAAERYLGSVEEIRNIFREYTFLTTNLLGSAQRLIEMEERGKEEARERRLEYLRERGKTRRERRLEERRYRENFEKAKEEIRSFFMRVPEERRRLTREQKERLSGKYRLSMKDLEKMLREMEGSMAVAILYSELVRYAQAREKAMVELLSDLSEDHKRLIESFGKGGTAISDVVEGAKRLKEKAKDVRMDYRGRGEKFEPALRFLSEKIETKLEEATSQYLEDIAVEAGEADFSFKNARNIMQRGGFRVEDITPEERQEMLGVFKEKLRKAILSQINTLLGSLRNKAKEIDRENIYQGKIPAARTKKLQPMGFFFRNFTRGIRKGVDRAVDSAVKRGHYVPTIGDFEPMFAQAVGRIDTTEDYGRQLADTFREELNNFFERILDQVVQQERRRQTSTAAVKTESKRIIAKTIN